MSETGDRGLNREKVLALAILLEKETGKAENMLRGVENAIEQNISVEQAMKMVDALTEYSKYLQQQLAEKTPENDAAFMDFINTATWNKDKQLPKTPNGLATMAKDKLNAYIQSKNPQ